MLPNLIICYKPSQSKSCRYTLKMLTNNAIHFCGITKDPNSVCTICRDQLTVVGWGSQTLCFMIVQLVLGTCTRFCANRESSTLVCLGKCFVQPSFSCTLYCSQIAPRCKYSSSCLSYAVGLDESCAELQGQPPFPSACGNLIKSEALNWQSTIFLEAVVPKREQSVR